MKRVIVFCILVCATVSLLAQTINDLKSAAEQGDVEAQCFLGMCYMEGVNGVSRDVNEAIKWFRKSAEKDFPPAQVFLGALYYSGTGVTQSNSNALYWLEKAYKNWGTMSSEMREMLAQQGLDKARIESIIADLK
jgi:TPR repeat protein